MSLATRVHRCGSSASARRSVSRMIRYSSETDRSSSSTVGTTPVFSYSTPLCTSSVASPPSSRIMFGPTTRRPASSRNLNSCSVAHQYSASVSPFQANTGTPCGSSGGAVRADDDGGGRVVLGGEDVAGHPAHVGAQADQCLDQHGGLHGHVQRAGDRGRRAAAGPRRTRGAAPSGRASRARRAGSPCGRTRRAPGRRRRSRSRRGSWKRRPAVSGGGARRHCGGRGHGVSLLGGARCGPGRTYPAAAPCGAARPVGMRWARCRVAAHACAERCDTAASSRISSEAPFVPVNRGPSVADDVRCSASRPGQVVPVQDRQRPDDVKPARSDAGVSPAGGPAATPGGPVVPGGRQHARRGRPRSRRPPPPALASSPASSTSALQRRHDRRQRVRVGAPEHPAGQHQQPDVGRRRPGLVRREVAAHGEDGGQRRDPAVLGRAARVAGHVADLAGHPLDRRAEQVRLDRVHDPLGLAFHEHPGRGRAHPEIALHRQPRPVVGPRSARPWSRSRRRPPAPGTPSIRASSAAPAGHHVRRADPHHPPEPRRRRRGPPAEDVVGVELGDRRPGRARHQLAGPRRDVGAGHHRAAGRGEQRHRVVAGRLVARQHDREPDARPGQPGGVVQQRGAGRRRPRRRSAAPRRAGFRAASARRRGPWARRARAPPAPRRSAPPGAPASSAVSRSVPTAASRSPPPTDEQASSSGSAAPGAAATTARTAASTPARTSATVVGCSANPASAPSDRTRTAFVQVEPTSTQTAALASSLSRGGA